MHAGACSDFSLGCNRRTTALLTPGGSPHVGSKLKETHVVMPTNLRILPVEPWHSHSLGAPGSHAIELPFHARPASPWHSTLFDAANVALWHPDGTILAYSVSGQGLCVCHTSWRVPPALTRRLSTRQSTRLCPLMILRYTADTPDPCNAVISPPLCVFFERRRRWSTPSMGVQALRKGRSSGKMIKRSCFDPRHRSFRQSISQDDYGYCYEQTARSSFSDVFDHRGRDRQFRQGTQRQHPCCHGRTTARGTKG
jgi:hypothetical protein